MYGVLLRALGARQQFAGPFPTSYVLGGLHRQNTSYLGVGVKFGSYLNWMGTLYTCAQEADAKRLKVSNGKKAESASNKPPIGCRAALAGQWGLVLELQPKPSGV